MRHASGASSWKPSRSLGLVPSPTAACTRRQRRSALSLGHVRAPAASVGSGVQFMTEASAAMTMKTMLRVCMVGVASDAAGGAGWSWLGYAAAYALYTLWTVLKRRRCSGRHSCWRAHKQRTRCPQDHLREKDRETCWDCHGAHVSRTPCVPARVRSTERIIVLSDDYSYEKNHQHLVFPSCHLKMEQTDGPRSGGV